MDDPDKSQPSLPDVMDENEFVARLKHLLEDTESGHRCIIALAGPPASGKTTLAARAVDALNADAPGASTVLPMDGYHFDDELLVPRGWRARKGAPHTFDVHGLHAMLLRLAANEEQSIVAPRFDRELEIARAGAISIDKAVRLIIVEGLYLLIDRDPWRRLSSVFDTRVLLRVTESTLRERLRQRWQHFNLDEDEIKTKLEANDMPNGQLVISESRNVDWIVEN